MVKNYSIDKIKNFKTRTINTNIELLINKLGIKEDEFIYEKRFFWRIKLNF
jgi:alanyl-tRNA synthetase